MSNTDIRGTNGVGTPISINADGNRSLVVALGSPAYAQTSGRGEGWTVGTATLMAPIVAYPTTTAALEVYNNSTTRTMVIQELYAAQVLGTAASQTYAIFAMVSTIKAVPSLTALSLFSTSGRALITPTASGEVVTGVGTTVIANGWRPWGPPQAWGTATATPGNAWSVPVDGKLVVPRGASICLHIVGALATASTFQVGLTFDWDTMTVET